MPPRRLPPLNSLRAFEALRITGSISGAAEHLSVSHSAISHQIKTLQQWVGQPLVVRSGKSVTLTPAGESLGHVVQGAFDAIRHELDLVPLRFRRSVSLAAAPIVMEEIILPRLPEFAARHPDTLLHLRNAVSDRSEATAPDIEIRFKRRDRQLAGELPFLPGTAIPVAAPALVERFGGDVMETLRNAPLISDEDSRMWQTWWQRHRGAEIAEDARGVIYFEGSLLMMRAAAAGLGIALARTAALDRALAEGTLVQLSSQSIDEDWAYMLRTGPESAFEPAVRHVLDWLETLSLHRAGAA